VTGLLGSDTVTGLSETYSNKNAGSGKTINAAGSVNDGNGGANYAVSFVASTAGVIRARAITVTAATNSKQYDGTTIAAAKPTINSGGLVGSDTSAFTETYDNKNVGTGKTLTAAGSVNDGNGGHNYAVTFKTISTGAITTISNVIDDTSPGFTVLSGSWSYWTTQGNWTSPAYLGNDREAVTPAGLGGSSAQWAFSGLTPGTYDVYATWPACANRATDVPYSVTGGGITTTVTVNQKIPPANQVNAATILDSGPTGTTPWTWLQLVGGTSSAPVTVYTVGQDGKLVVGISNKGLHAAVPTVYQVEADAVMIQLVAAAQGSIARAKLGGQGGVAAAQAQASDAVFAGLAEPQGGTTANTPAGSKSDAWWLMYGEE
jgi:hypothetical protein